MPGYRFPFKRWVLSAGLFTTNRTTSEDHLEGSRSSGWRPGHLLAVTSRVANAGEPDGGGRFVVLDLPGSDYVYMTPDCAAELGLRLIEASAFGRTE